MGYTLDGHVWAQLLGLLIYPEDGDELASAGSERLYTKFLGVRFRNSVKSEAQRVVREILNLRDGFSVPVLRSNISSICRLEDKSMGLTSNTTSAPNDLQSS